MQGAFFVEDEQNIAFPSWFKGFIQFTAQIARLPEVEEGNQELFIFSAPRVDGLLAAAALGSLYVEVSKIKSSSEIHEISLGDLKIGMLVSVFCGNQGYQAVGEVTDIDLEDRNPRIRVAGTFIAVKSIRSILSLTDSVGEPKQFKKRRATGSQEISSIVSFLLDSSIPINRSLVSIRATSSFVDREFSVKVRDESMTEAVSIKELLKPINSNSSGTGLTTVFNSNEDEHMETLSARNDISVEYLDAPICILSGASAISAQLNNVLSRKVIGVIGRNERLAETASLAVRDAYAYSYENCPPLNDEKLPQGLEFVTFGRTRI